MKFCEQSQGFDKSPEGLCSPTVRPPDRSVNRRPLSARSVLLVLTHWWMLFPALVEQVAAQGRGKVNVTRASNSAAFQARGPDFTRLAGLALSGLQNDTLLLTDVVLPASKLDLKREQAQINALNARLSASQQGPTGATGAQGPTGTGGPGASGGPGLPGSPGATGEGATGGTGASGSDGDAGATGASGQAGATGASGPSGADGNTGANGATGANGNTGGNGATGDIGGTGPTGGTGAIGAGPTGPTGGTGNGGTGTTGDFSVGGALTVNGASNLIAPVTITDTRTNPPSPALAVLGTSSFGATTPVTISAAGASTFGALVTFNSGFISQASAVVNGGLTVQQAAQLNGGLTVQGSTTLQQNLNVVGSSNFAAANFGGAVTIPSGPVTIGTNTAATGSILTVAGQATITTLAVTNAATISHLTATGGATVGGGLGVTGGVTVDALAVTGTADFITEAIFENGLQSRAAAEVDGPLTVNGAAQLNNGLVVQGTTTLGGLVTIQQNLNVVGSSNFAAASFGGAVTISTLAVTNAATISGPLTVASGTTQFSVSQTGVVGIGTNAPVAGSTLTAIGQITLGSTLNPVTITANGQVSIQNSADNALAVNGGGAFVGIVTTNVGFSAKPFVAILPTGADVTPPAGTTNIYAIFSGAGPAVLRLPLPAGSQVATGQIIHIAIPAGITGSATLNCPASASCTINSGTGNAGVTLLPVAGGCYFASTVRCEGYNDPTTSSGTPNTTTTNDYQCVRTCTNLINEI